MVGRLVACGFGLFCILIWGGCHGLAPGVDQLTVNLSGSGTGTVTSTPPGINCPGQCSANFNNTQVTLTASPGSGFSFGGWTGCPTSDTTCVVPGGTATITASFSAGLQSINHIILLSQENRSFDSYFGAMRQYWAQNGYSDQPFDGLPQFNPTAGQDPTNPGCNPATSTTTVCHVNPASGDVGPPVPSFHFQTMCVENPSPSWDEAHGQWNASDPVAPPPPTLDGFVRAAANVARQTVPPFNDVAGMRAMGYYDGNDLNYYYFMASNFATSDTWFSPVLTRTPPNREYLNGATSYGYVYAIGSNPGDQNLIPSSPIYEKLTQANISWKIYVDPTATICASNPTSSCLYKFTYVKDFDYGRTILNTPSLLQNIVPISQFKADLQAGTLPQFAQIEPSSNAGLDEHPADFDVSPPCCSVQQGAAYVSDFINSLMSSSSWQDSLFILTFDESGGFYDHVSPAPAVSPDGIPPSDLFANDVCTGAVGPNCDFVFTGYRIPMIVISPYTKKNYVSHAVADNTAILKLIETRFGLTSLTARDAAQIDMSQEFLDFTNVPWKTPPSPPKQNTNGACYLDHLP
jgi:phospholipase C